jgi:hypothetical protein
MAGDEAGPCGGEMTYSDMKTSSQAVCGIQAGLMIIDTDLTYLRLHLYIHKIYF